MPTVIAVLGTTLSTFGNTLLAGRFLGSDALSAMNVLSSFTFLYAMIGCLISVGASSLASIAIGRRDLVTVGKYETLALVLSIVIPVVISGLCFIDYHGLILFLGADEQIYQLSISYGRIVIAFGFLNALMYFPFNFLRLDGRAKMGMISFGAMGVLDLVLVYAFLSMGMGLKGVAIGSVISMAVANIVGIGMLLSKKSGIKPVIIKKNEVLMLTVSSFVSGSSAGLNNLCKMIRTVMLNALVIKNLGANHLSVLAVGCAIINLTSASVTGFGQALAPIVGIFHGERDKQGKKSALISTLLDCTIYHVVIAIIAIVGARFIAGAFGITEPELVREAIIMIRLVGISLIPAAAINIFIYYFTAIKENFMAMTLTVMHTFVLVVGFVALHFMFDKSTWYGIAFISAEVFDFLVLFVVSAIRRKQNSNLEGVLLNDKNSSEKFFSVVSDGTRDGAVKSAEEVVGFFEENDVPVKLCMKLQLVVEELLVVLATHCLDGEEADKQGINVKVTVIEDDVLMRLRCSGEVFNPIEWYYSKKNSMDPMDFMMDEAFSMNLVAKMVTDVKYTRTFGLNNLIVLINQKQ